MLWSGRSLRDANGASSIRHSMRSSGVGAGTPESPSPIGAGGRPATERTIQTLDDVHAAVNHYVENIPYDEILSTATHISTDIDLTVVSKEDMAAALARREHAGPKERDIYASYINEAYLNALEARNAKIIFQFSLGRGAAAV